MLQEPFAALIMYAPGAAGTTSDVVTQPAKMIAIEKADMRRDMAHILRDSVAGISSASPDIIAVRRVTLDPHRVCARSRSSASSASKPVRDDPLLT